MKILTVVSPILLRILLHRAAVRLQLLVQAAAVDEDGLAGLGIPSSLPKHLLQLLERVAAFPLPNTVLLHAAVAPAKGLRQKKKQKSTLIRRRRGWKSTHSLADSYTAARQSLGVCFSFFFFLNCADQYLPHAHELNAMLPN